MNLSTIDSCARIPGGVSLTSGGCEIKFIFADEKTLHYTAHPFGQPEEKNEEALAADIGQPCGTQYRFEEGVVSVCTAYLTLRVWLDPFGFELLDRDGGTLVSTPKGETLDFDGTRFIQRFSLAGDERLYGMGQSTTARLELRGRERRHWQQWDGGRYSGNICIPFFLSSRGYGYCCNSPWAARFLFGGGGVEPATGMVRPDDYWPREPLESESDPARWCVVPEGGSVDCFFLYGPGYPDIIRAYHALTGFPSMPPAWALGYIQSKNRYRNQRQVLETAREFRRRGLPCDVIVVDWCWFKYFGFLEWLPEDWPDPEGMFRELKRMGIKAIMAQHPYMHAESPHFKEFRDRGLLIEWDRADLKDGWPPDGIRHAVDFSNPGARKLWWSKIEPFVEQGLSGYWLDMGELEVHPKSSTESFAGPRERSHNPYALHWAKALHDGQRSHDDRRAFILTRSAYGGIWRCGAAMWSGDVDPSWEVLRDQVVAGLQASLSAMPYWGTDIGGFMSAAEYDPELYIRWMQWGAFTPLFRTHGTRPGNEPWSFGAAAEETIGSLIRLRYRFLPYIYSLIHQCHETGMPPMRAMPLAFPLEAEARRYERQYMFGSGLLVIPAVEKGKRSVSACLPQGLWYDFWSGRAMAGGREAELDAPLEQPALLVPAGTILPLCEGEPQNAAGCFDKLGIHIFPGKNARCELYEDDGETNAYERGESATTRIEYDDETRALTVHPRKGKYAGMRKRRDLSVFLHEDGHTAAMGLGRRATDRAIRIDLKTESRKAAALPEKPRLETFPQPLSGREGYRVDAWAYGCADPAGRFSVDVPDGFECRTGDAALRIQNGRAGAVFEILPAGDFRPASARCRVRFDSTGASLNKTVAFGSGYGSRFRLHQPSEGGEEAFERALLAGQTPPGGVPWAGTDCFGYVNLNKVFNHMDIVELSVSPPKSMIAYARCIVDAPRAGRYAFHVTGEDLFKVWVNAKEAAEFSDCAAKAAVFRADLKQGANTVLLRCRCLARREWNDRAWGFFFKVAGPGGSDEGVRYGIGPDEPAAGSVRHE